MLSLVLFRGALLAAPFVAWFVWRAWARRTGREMGSTPWPWLFAIGAVLVALSLMATALFRTEDNRQGVYVPGEVQADGSVTEGYFKQPAPK